LTEIRRRIEVCYDERMSEYGWDLAYYSSMNISATTPGWIHPKIAERLKS